MRKNSKITTPGQPFEASDKLEINNLISKGVFEFIQFDENTHGVARLFKSRLVREIKIDSNKQEYEKSRLVIQGYADENKKEILTQSPTIQRASQRLMLAIAPALANTIAASISLRNITQAYVQSAIALNRVIFAQLPKEIAHKHPASTIIKVIKPLYGIAESGLF